MSLNISSYEQENYDFFHYKTKNDLSQKDAPPEKTIHRIRECLLNCGISIYERTWASPADNIYSVRVTTDFDTSKFGTNGKGVTEELALASALAEFMERIQNGFFTDYFSYKNINYFSSRFGFYFFPDEKMISKEEFRKTMINLGYDAEIISRQSYGASLDELYQFLNQNDKLGVSSSPFKNIRNNDITYIPNLFIQDSVGSNGMCAGNTQEEAISQGICEILERYSTNLLFYNRMTPPTIPHEKIQHFSKASELLNLLKLKFPTLDFIFKECSCNLKIPAIGIIVIDNEKSLYRFNVGCDLNPEIAFIRCMTEVFQGFDSLEDFHELALPISKMDQMINKFMDESALEQYQDYQKDEYEKFVIDGRGQFPYELLGTEQSYILSETHFYDATKSSKRLEFLVQFIEKMGHQVFVRDSSYLDFPAYHVYIPHLSQLGKKTRFSTHKNMFTHGELEKSEWAQMAIFSIKNLSNDELLRIVDYIGYFDYSMSLSKLFCIKLDEKSEWSLYPVALLLLILALKIENFKVAKEACESLVTHPIFNNSYYKTIVLLIDRKIDSNTFFDPNEYDEDTRDIYKDITNKETLFQHLKLPQCPKCTNCELNNVCKTKGDIQLGERIYQKMKTNLGNREIK